MRPGHQRLYNQRPVLTINNCSFCFSVTGFVRAHGKAVMGYVCATCGKEHHDLPHIGSPVPFQWANELAEDPSSLLTDDLCVIQGRDYFVRGVIEVPIHDSDQTFGWGV